MKKEIWQKNHQLGHYHTHGDSHYPRHYLVHRDNELKRGLVSWSVGQFIFTLSTTAHHSFLFPQKAPTRFNDLAGGASPKKLYRESVGFINRADTYSIPGRLGEDIAYPMTNRMDASSCNAVFVHKDILHGISTTLREFFVVFFRTFR